MQIQHIRHSARTGWSHPFPDLDSDQTMVLVFGATEYADEAEPLAQLRAHYPEATLAGCSTSGEIHGAEVWDSSLAVAVVRFDATLVRFAATPITAETSFDAGVALAGQLDNSHLAGIFVLCEGLDVNGSNLVRGLTATLHDDVSVSGGLAGDAARFDRTWTLVDGKPTTGFVTAVGWYGERIRIGHGSQGGWDIFGPRRLITRSRSNVLYELDGRPALELYKMYLGELAVGLPATGLRFPLSVDLPDGSTVVRTILAVDEADNSLTYAGDVPQGATATLMQASLERLIDGAEAAGGQAARGAADLSIAISCVGRRLVMGERVEEETDAVLDHLPLGTVQVGFYSYGEIAPNGQKGEAGFSTCDLHNQTMTITTLTEL